MATKKADVRPGQVWTIRLSTGRMARVKVVSIEEYSGYTSVFGRQPGRTTYALIDLDTGREFTIRSATKLRVKISEMYQREGGHDGRLRLLIQVVRSPRAHAQDGVMVERKVLAVTTAWVDADPTENEVITALETALRQMREDLERRTRG